MYHQLIGEYKQKKELNNLYVATMLKVSYQFKEEYHTSH